MRSNYKRIGQFVRQVNNRNDGLAVVDLKGISINKQFMPSVANINGTDLSNYKVVSKYQFAYNPMHVGRDEVLPIGMLESDELVIVSPAYVVFEIIDPEALLPEYLMMWCRRPEFDRNCWFTTDSSVRGGFNWDDFCDMTLPVPHPDKQREIVREYNTIVERIKLNEQLIQKLEETAQALFKQWFLDFEFPIPKEYAEFLGNRELTDKPYKSTVGDMVFTEFLDSEIPIQWKALKMSELISVKDGTHDSPKPVSSGFPLVTSTHLTPYSLLLEDAYFISAEDFDQVNKRSKVHQFDILISMIGTVGEISYVLYDNINFAIKNVGLFKCSEKAELADYIYFWLKSEYTKKYIETCMLGSTQSYISLTDLRGIPILLPPSKLIAKFRKYSSEIINLTHIIGNENLLLSRAIKLLLSKITQV